MASRLEDKTASQADDLAVLTSIGFGPETVLMNDPKLFVDSRFLASLLVELEDELGKDATQLALFQIGLMHGFRDAERIIGFQSGDEPGFLFGETTAVVMDFTAGATMDGEYGMVFSGRFPERYEAIARISRLGQTDAPACLLSAGYASGWLSATNDAEILVKEVGCAAAGHEECRFVAREIAGWRRDGDPAALRLSSAVSFDSCRRIAAERADARRLEPSGTGAGAFDRSEPVVHIWGPVMVLPFTSVDEALGTVEMLGREPGSEEVRVVIIDLLNITLDEGFGAAALEQVLESIEAWGAEAILTGVSPFSEAAVAGLEASHLLVRKELADAIASAFQIVDAQRHLV